MKKPLKIAIIGNGARQSSVSMYDGTWTFWGINSVHRRIDAPWAKMFNLHRLAHLERDCAEYVDWDCAFSRRNPDVPIVTVDSWGRLLKRQEIYPLKAMAAQPRAHYHASSFDMMVALAIHLKAKVIHLHGARFALDGPGDEPISARACLEYWCGYAEGRGIKVQEIASKGLFRQFHLVMSDSIYGFDDVRMVEGRRR